MSFAMGRSFLAFGNQIQLHCRRSMSIAGRHNITNPKVAIAGVTGAVGQEFLKLLQDRKFPVEPQNLKLLASKRSAGRKYNFAGQELTVEEMTEDSFNGVDIALFSAGGSQSKKYGPIAVKNGCIVVDNSSAFRMDPNTPLVVPEINPQACLQHNGIIANPNCTTIIMAVAVYPLYKAAGGIKRIVMSTYQAASGAGQAAMDELVDQAKAWVNDKPLPQDIWGRQYIFNVFSHNSSMTSNGYNEEEMKVVNETRKIFEDKDIRVSATCIRVPVLRTHCEAINLTFNNPISEEQVRAALAKAPGVIVHDDRKNNQFPEPIMGAGKDEVFVGRIRPDVSQDQGIGYELFIAGDQLLKGAALNAVQIAELLVKKN